MCYYLPTVLKFLYHDIIFSTIHEVSESQLHKYLTPSSKNSKRVKLSDNYFLSVLISSLSQVVCHLQSFHTYMCVFLLNFIVYDECIKSCSIKNTGNIYSLRCFVSFFNFKMYRIFGNCYFSVDL